MQVTIDASWFKAISLLAIGIITLFKEITKRNKIKSYSSSNFEKMNKNANISLASNGSTMKRIYSSNNIRGRFIIIIQNKKTIKIKKSS